MTPPWRKKSQFAEALIPIVAWTVFIALLAGSTIYLHHRDVIHEAENEARDYFRLNLAYRAWASELGGVYANRDLVQPNPHLKVPRRDVTTTDGEHLTLVNPAYMTRMVFDTIKRSSPSPTLNKITSLKPLNPDNAPDPWERQALLQFEQGLATERAEVASVGGKPYLRFISAFLVEPSCLKCHGSQGYKVGDVRGGITISIPLEGYYFSEGRTRNALTAGYLLLWVVGAGGVAVSARRRHEYEEELRAGEEELRAGEEKFRTVCDWTQDWEYWVDQHGGMKYISPSCQEITGYDRESFMQDPELLQRLVHPEDRELFEAHRRQGISGNTASSVEFRIVTGEGAVRWIHHTCRSVFSGVEYLGSRVSNRDITDRKLAEQELAIRAELLNCVSDSVFVIDAAGRILDANDAAWRTRGYTREELLAMRVEELESPAYAAIVPQRLDQVLARGGGVMESEHLLKDGSRICVEINNRVIDYRGRKAILSSIRDVTALKENERKLQVIFDVTQSGIVQIDQSGAITFANQRMAEMFCLPMDELLGSSYTGHVCEEQREEAQRCLRMLLNGELQSAHFERHYLRSDGTKFWGYLTGRRLAGGDDSHARLVATITDMTELKCAEEKRHRSEQQMLHVQKLESLGVLAGGIAHDFNNILLAIMGNTSLALQHLEPGTAVETYLRQVEKASEKAADLARQMLAYSGKGRFVLETVDLNRLVHEMTSMLEVSLSKKATLRFHLAEPLPGILADPTQIRQIVMNLAINASEAIGENSGVITIATGALHCDGNYLSESWMSEKLTEGRYVFLEVTDTGCGMSQETVSRIFEPFFTTKFTGRGLGMSAILGIVRGHKGAIKVYSEPGKGSSFKILLPATEPSAEETVAGEASASWKGSGTVLLVDDEETVRQVTGAMLDALGYEVIAAVDGRDALDKYLAHGDRISLVLMDLNMPNLNGEEAFHELRRMDARVRVVLSSGFSEQEVTRKFLGKGLEGFIQKPYTLAALRNLLSRL